MLYTNIYSLIDIKIIKLKKYCYWYIKRKQEIKIKITQDKYSLKKYKTNIHHW